MFQLPLPTSILTELTRDTDTVTDTDFNFWEVDRLLFLCKRHSPNSTPRHKTNTCRKNSWGINFCANTCGACIRTPANTGKHFLRRYFPSILPNRGIHSVRIHAAPVFAPARIQENIPGELFMYWFRARGYSARFLCMVPRPALWWLSTGWLV